MNKEEVEKIKNTPIVFVLGSSRSGTTLLQEMLDSNPYIVGPPESDFILHLYPRFGGIKNWKEKDILDFADALFELPRIPKIWLLDKEQIQKELLSIRDWADYRLLCKMIFLQKRKDKENILLFSDKDPRNSFFAARLLEIFPQALFIHIVRDPRDVVNGTIKRLKKKNTFFIASQWVGLNKSIERVKKIEPSRFYTVLYEKMVTNPDDTFKAICEFLEVPYGDSIMKNRFSENIEDLKNTEPFEKYKAIHESLMKPVNTSNIGKWKMEMSEFDIAVTERITEKYAMEKYGYYLNGTNKSKVHVPGFKLLKIKVLYFSWEIFTSLRYRWYGFNSFYRKRYIKGYGL